MKKLFFVFLVLVLCVSISGAGTTDKLKSVIARKNVAAGGGGCDTSDETCVATGDDGDVDLADTGNLTYIAGKFVASGTDAICRVDIEVFKTGNGGADYTLGIWSDTAGAPTAGGMIGTASDATDPSTVTGTTIGTAELLSFTGLDSGALVNSTTYWIVVWRGSVDAANYLSWVYESTTSDCGSVGGMQKDSDDTSWAVQNSNSPTFTIYH